VTNPLAAAWDAGADLDGTVIYLRAFLQSMEMGYSPTLRRLQAQFVGVNSRNEFVVIPSRPFARIDTAAAVSDRRAGIDRAHRGEGAARGARGADRTVATPTVELALRGPAVPA